jgi:hypothetical protein
MLSCSSLVSYTHENTALPHKVSTPERSGAIDLASKIFAKAFEEATHVTLEAFAPLFKASTEKTVFYEIKQDMGVLESRLELTLATAPKTLLPLLKPNLLSIYKISQRWIDAEFSRYIVPTDLGLMMLASYYQAKYNICIMVVGSSKKVQEALLGNFVDPSCRVWGVICTSGHESYLHVTPILCFRNASGFLQIADLDSIKDPIDELKYTLTDLIRSGQKVESFQVKLPRQADYYSCRTDAIVLLKDALRDIEAQKIDDLREILDLPAGDKSHEFNLPIRWSKSCQISRHVLGDESLHVINKSDEPYKVFKERFQKKLLRSQEFVCVNRKENGDLEEEQHILIEEKTVNTFLKEKSLRHAHIMNRLKDSPPLEIDMLFRLAQSFYK